MEPVITGPSFLGLNTPAEVNDRSAGRGHGGHDALRPSSNVDYLLEDEEEPRGRGKWILVVMALALVVGFGYLRWKQGGFEWLSGGDRRSLPSLRRKRRMPRRAGTLGRLRAVQLRGQGRLRLREVWRIRRNLVRRRLVLRKILRKRRLRRAVPLRMR